MLIFSEITQDHSSIQNVHQKGHLYPKGVKLVKGQIPKVMKTTKLYYWRKKIFIALLELVFNCLFLARLVLQRLSNKVG